MPDPRFAALAESAYRAYGDQAEWKNYAGDPMPAWADLGERIQGCWTAAAGAVYEQVGLPIASEGEE